MKKAVSDTESLAIAAHLDEEAKSHLLASKKLEASYAGIIGKNLEASISPLGFDWKIGIALVTSFAAREVFIGTISTIYRIGSDETDTRTVIETLRQEKNPVTGKPVFNLASGVSLLIFYLLAMQCMSTFAVVYRETNSWTWPMAQLFYMTGMAYLFSFISFQLLSPFV
ncbi:MAG: ferrous iron transporter B, partial [Cytophagales bacterium]|nr:ferrous iron transporter B [Cytophagales bacterium]